MPSYEYSDYDEIIFTADTRTWESCNAVQIQQQYEEWVQENERQDCIIEMQMRENALREIERQEDRRKFPLFFWKKGIV